MNKEHLININSLDNARFTFESVTDRPNNFGLAGDKWSHIHFHIDQLWEVPLVGAEMANDDPDFWVHPTMSVVEGVMPRECEDGYSASLLTLKGDTETFARYPVLINSGNLPKDNKLPENNAVITWMSHMEAAQLFPKIPLLVRENVVIDIGNRIQSHLKNIDELYADFPMVNIDVFSNGVSTNILPPAFLQRAFPIYQEQLEISRDVYGVWITAVKSGNKSDMEMINTIITDASGMQRVFSKEQPIEAVIQTIKDSRGKAKFDIPTSGLFGEFEAYNLSNLLHNKLEKDDIDDKEMKAIANSFLYLVTSLLMSYPVDRFMVYVQPTWDSLKNKLKILGFENIIEDIRLEIQNANYELLDVFFDDEA
ncbi:hypothetical protein KA017_00510 [Candidatus Woesebacteria bacterium]|nr:hypothetical protein [Candidatus Woesebacteria bacterium]